MRPEEPIRLSEALYLAAMVARRNEELEAELMELRMNGQYPEVLQSKHIIALMGIGASTLSQWAKDPTFPHLDSSWQSGQTIRCLKVEFYNWLKTRNNRKSEEVVQGRNDLRNIREKLKLVSS